MQYIRQKTNSISFYADPVDAIQVPDALSFFSHWFSLFARQFFFRLKFHRKPDEDFLPVKEALISLFSSLINA